MSSSLVSCCDRRLTNQRILTIYFTSLAPLAQRLMKMLRGNIRFVSHYRLGMDGWTDKDCLNKRRETEQGNVVWAENLSLFFLFWRIIPFSHTQTSCFVSPIHSSINCLWLRVSGCREPLLWISLAKKGPVPFHFKYIINLNKKKKLPFFFPERLNMFVWVWDNGADRNGIAIQFAGFSPYLLLPPPPSSKK